MQPGPVCCSNGIRGFGNVDSKVFLVGISPAATEMKVGRPMIGPSGNLTNNILKACGWSREQTYATNIICYENREPTLEQILECRPRLLAEVNDFKPDLLVLLGATVGELFFPSRKYGTVRGAIDFYAPWGVHVLPTYHPAALLHRGDSGKETNERITRDIVRDFLKIKQFFEAPPNAQVDFHVVQDVIEAQTILDNLPRGTGFIALDVETHLDKDLDETVPVEENVVCFSISDGVTTWWFPGNILAKLTWPKDVNWTFHNGMFDTIALQEAIGVLLPIKHDTLYMSYALDERGGQHKLKYLARENLASGFYEDHSTAKKWEDKVADTTWIQTYNAKDAAYTARLAARLHARMTDDNVLGVYERLLIPGANLYRLMQQHGVYVNQERYFTLLKEYSPLWSQRDQELRDTIGSLGGDSHINLGSPLQLRKFLYGVLRLPGGPSTAAPIIEALADEHPFINQLLDYRHLEKALNTYIVGAWDDIRLTGRIHPNPGLHSQVTGRVAYKPYAINTLPRETNENPYLNKIRWMFTAPDSDTCLVMVDYVQAEIWNAWIYCQDANMWADLQSGDYHTANASWIFGVPLHAVSKGQRSDSKKTTFGSFFGIGDKKLAKQTGKPVAQAHAYQEAWRFRYPGYMKYKEDIIREAQTTGELVTITGRKRRFPILLDTSFINQAINYKIQSTSHDYLLDSLINMWDDIIDLGAFPIADLHDAIAFESPVSVALEVAKCAMHYMTKPRFGLDLSIPADFKIGYSLGETA